MNERIAQLARDAGVISVFNAAPNRPDIEKFAELIVRECAKSAYDWYENHHNFHWDPATHVLGHFGVEP